MLSGIKNYCTGNKGNASELEESPVAEPDKSLEKADATADDADDEFTSYLNSEKKAVEPV